PPLAPWSMVANCASSRGHIGLTGAPCCCGGAPGLVCARASTQTTLTPTSAAKAKIHRENGVISVSGISGHRDSARADKPKARPGAADLKFPRYFASSYQKLQIDKRRQR